LGEVLEEMRTPRRGWSRHLGGEVEVREDLEHDLGVRNEGDDSDGAGDAFGAVLQVKPEGELEQISLRDSSRRRVAGHYDRQFVDGVGDTGASSIFGMARRGDGDDFVATGGVRPKDAMVPGQVEVWPRDQRGEPMEQRRRFEDDRACAAGSKGALERVADPAVVEEGEVLWGKGLPRSVTDEAQEALAVVGGEGDVGVQ
jgi:hypothetical protein